MEAIGAASAILAIATAGVQCSVKLVTFAGQVKTSPEHITKVAEDVSLNASILQQLGELAEASVEKEHPASDGNNTTDNNVSPVADIKTTISKQSIFNTAGLETVIKLAKKCEGIFQSLDQSLGKASKHLYATSRISDKVKLSRTEMFKWPFLLPGIDTMRTELRDVKGTLLLMLQVAMLAYSRRMMGEYSTIQRTTAIVAYSREDQDLLVRSIVAAQKSQQPLEKEQTQFSQVSLHSKQGPPTMDPGLNGTAASARKDPDISLESNVDDEASSDNELGSSRNGDTSERQSSDSQCQIFSPSRIFSINLISPSASITNHQIHVKYDVRSIKLPDSMIQSQLSEWKRSLGTTVLDQLAALDNNEYDALDATGNHSEKTLEWIQFGEYRTILQGIGIGHLKARTLTVIMSGVPRPTSLFEKKRKEWKREEKKREDEEEERVTWIKVHREHILPDTLIEYGLPWDWDEHDTNYIVIKKWITEDLQEELYVHTRWLRESEAVTKASSTTTELKVERKEHMYLIRKKDSAARSISEIGPSIPLINRGKQEQGGMEQTPDDEEDADMKDEDMRQRLRSDFDYKEDVEEILNWKRADEGNRDMGEKRQRAEKETDNYEDDETLSESDDAEGIVDALLARYTV